jgi:D-alanine-D-alanine ligase
LRIAVFLGGVSAEREISFLSGRGIVNALREAGYDVLPIDPALGSNQPTDAEELLQTTVATGPPTLEELARLKPRALIECVDSPLLDGIDLVFIALHGMWGEDGTVQSLLEMRGVRYTGSGVLASALAMDKAMAKSVFRHVGVLTADWYVAESNATEEGFTHTAERLGYPLVVKPNTGGSTVGLSIVRTSSELAAAVEEARNYASRVLLERFIDGRELTVSILGDKVLPIIEIRPEGGFYDYKHKYTRGMTEYICPAELPENVAQDVHEKALLAFRSLGCHGFGRVDFRLDADGDSYCLEVNTVPGMTATSLVPKAAAAAGYSFADLCDRIVKLSTRG